MYTIKSHFGGLVVIGNPTNNHSQIITFNNESIIVDSRNECFESQQWNIVRCLY